jgi:hypothetical protein
LATDLKNLALLYRATSRLAEAELLYRRALSIIEKSLPADHPHQALFRENYARLLDQLGRGQEAASLRAQTAAARPSVGPPEDGRTK